MNELRLPYDHVELPERLKMIKSEDELKEIISDWYAKNKDTVPDKQTVDVWIATYLEQNPTGGVSEEEIRAAVDSYLTNHPASDGKDGVSPTVEVTAITGGHRVTITDKNGPHTFDIMNGADGEGGSGSVTDEQIASAVQVYLTENPIEGGMTAEQLNTAISNYLAANAVTNMDEDTFDDMADEWIENIKIAGANLPVVFLEGDATGISKENAVPMKMRFVSQFKSFEETCTLKYQGTSSMSYPKKNFTVKLDSKHGVGWGKQKKYCLKANYIDHSHARNIVSARLWSQIVASRADYAEMPELLRTSPNNCAVDGFPIRMYLNEAYQGLYTMNVPKGAWMFNMDDTNENHCILCGENYVSGCFRGPANIDGSDWSDELHDIVPDSVKTRWNEIINFVMNSTDEVFKANITNYIDLQSLIDYYIYAYASAGLDSMGKNQIYYTYDGKKYYASMYDMDSTWGLYWNGQKFVSDTYRMQEDYEAMVDEREGNLLYFRLETLFKDEIEARYNELRGGVLSFSNILGEFERFMSCITTEQYSDDLTIYTCIPSGTTNNISQLRSYIPKRLSYVDGKMRKINITALSITGVSSVKVNSTIKLGASFEPSNANNYDLEWSSSDTNIATIDDTGLVTSVSAGDVTITVHDTVSNLSAAFNLSVIESQQSVDSTVYYGSKIDDNLGTTDIELPYKNFIVFGGRGTSTKRTILSFDEQMVLKSTLTGTGAYGDLAGNGSNCGRMTMSNSDGSNLDETEIVGYDWDSSTKQWVEVDNLFEEGCTAIQSFVKISSTTWWTRNNSCVIWFSNFDICNSTDTVIYEANYNQSVYE